MKKFALSFCFATLSSMLKESWTIDSDKEWQSTTKSEQAFEVTVYSFPKIKKILLAFPYPVPRLSANSAPLTFKQSPIWDDWAQIDNNVFLPVLRVITTFSYASRP